MRKPHAYASLIALLLSGIALAACPDPAATEIARLLAFQEPVARIASEDLAALRACGEDPARAGNLARFWQALAPSQDVDFSMGFQIPDAQYEAEAGDLLPEELAAPELLGELDAPATALAAIEKLASRHPDWNILPFVSRNLTTPDAASTWGRILVHVPGAIERFIQFGLNTDGYGPPSTAVSVVAARSGTTFFADELRTGDPAKPIRLRSARTDGGGAGVCYSCHKTGALPILPAAASSALAGFSPERLAAMNAAIRAAAAPAFGTALDPAAFGPSLGDPARASALAPAFFERCTAGVPLQHRSVSIARIRARMQCALCHEPQSLGALNFPAAAYGSDETPDLVRAFVLSGEMPPPRAGLPALDQAVGANEEREALFRCLRQDFYDPTSGALATWLSQAPPEVAR